MVGEKMTTKQIFLVFLIILVASYIWKGFIGFGMLFFFCLINGDIEHRRTT